MISKFTRFFAAFVAVCFAFVLFGSLLPQNVAIAAGDTISASGCNYPSTLTEGKSFSLKGKITSESSKIVRLVAGVFNASDKMVTGRSYNPNAKTVDLRWAVNPYVKFGKLAPGEYTYRITATNASVKETLLEEPFTVKAKPPVSDKLSISGSNYPTTLEKGKGFTVKGKVVSETSKLKKLTVGVYNDEGKMVTGRSWNPNAKTVNLQWSASDHVKFSKLSVGVYTYEVTAVNSAGEKTLLSEAFEVIPAKPIPDKLSASGMTHPTTIVQGKSFYLRGVVSSQTSKLTKLTAGVYNEDGKMVTGRSFNPKAKSVDFRWLVNPYMKFSSLKPGFYTYEVTAVNAAGEKTLLSETFEVTAAKPASDKLKASGLTYPKLLIQGRGFALKGVITSERSKITKLTAGVYDEDGKMITGRSFDPKAKSVDLRWQVDSYVKFGKLDVGFYTYKITATNATGTTTLLEKEFEVVE
jgi:hypothetical protein